MRQHHAKIKLVKQDGHSTRQRPYTYGFLFGYNGLCESRTRGIGTRTHLRLDGGLRHAARSLLRDGHEDH